jgi:hypothetical protein
LIDTGSFEVNLSPLGITQNQMRGRGMLRQVFLKKLIVIELVKNSLPFVEPKDSSPSSSPPHPSIKPIIFFISKIHCKITALPYNLQVVETS